MKIEMYETEEKSNESVVNEFYPIGDMDGNLEETNQILDGYIPGGFISIADDSGCNEILLGIDENYWGKVYFWDHDIDPEVENNINFLSETLTDFLSALY